MQLMAQAVPTATRLPCAAGMPFGWSVTTAETIRGTAIFGIGFGDGGSEPVTVTLTRSCPAPLEGTQQIPIEGGCVTYRSTIPDPDVPSFDANGGLSFTPRADLIAEVAGDDHQVLCGAFAPPCP